MRKIFMGIAFLTLAGCMMPQSQKSVDAPVVSPVVVPVAGPSPEGAALKEVGIIEALSANGCLIKQFKTTASNGSRSSITAKCNHVEVEED